MHLETSVPGKARYRCQPCSIAVLLKEITIDPTALLPMLFAGDSQGFPCQLGSHTAPLFLHQMARPTPSGCRMCPPPFPGGDEALTSIRLAFYAARAAGSEMTGPTPSQLKKKKVSAKRKDFQIRVAISVINEPAFSIALTSLLVHQIPIKGLFPQRDAVADKTVLPSRKLQSRGL